MTGGEQALRLWLAYPYSLLDVASIEASVQVLLEFQVGTRIENSYSISIPTMSRTLKTLGIPSATRDLDICGNNF